MSIKLAQLARLRQKADAILLCHFPKSHHRCITLLFELNYKSDISSEQITLLPNRSGIFIKARLYIFLFYVS